MAELLTHFTKQNYPYLSSVPGGTFCDHYLVWSQTAQEKVGFFVVADLLISVQSISYSMHGGTAKHESRNIVAEILLLTARFIRRPFSRALSFIASFVMTVLLQQSF